MTVRPALRWTLGATSLASVVALWWGEPAQPTGAAGQVNPATTESMTPQGATTGAVLTLPPLPVVLERALPEPAQRDVFNTAAAPTKPLPAPAPPAPPPVPQVVLAPEPPPPPPMTWRYLGGVRGPGGQALVYLGEGDQVVLAQPGTELPNGYRIEEVVRANSSDVLAVTEIRLIYPSLGYRQTLRVPMPVSP